MFLPFFISIPWENGDRENGENGGKMGKWGQRPIFSSKNRALSPFSPIFPFSLSPFSPSKGDKIND
ncbi:hypothetical protein COZ13_01530 [Candidatus Desantisbacteria bacterium CG_4_10_14_3_um_filter_40_18]|uniref:Uncharacterized protein n=1 Tax=Candidatus Desantisbacteria bacterium CG_4_10_14_3_um_filter_40_18 TaxID=1974544 RepID=A0A2M7P492_9BACT|nr:MAG: hypothetical protein COZ13_01530 [Candidatus Desantisbacteria bacterium CG_4_10_14_3_um_filter_40_18]